MTLRRRERSGEICSEGGLSGFVRDLLSNIPWSERLEREETLDIEAPESRALRVYNSNGRTAVWGEDRDDIEARITKIARAESEEGARELLDEIRVTSTDIAGALELDVEIPLARDTKYQARPLLVVEGLAQRLVLALRQERDQVQDATGPLAGDSGRWQLNLRIRGARP